MEGSLYQVVVYSFENVNSSGWAQLGAGKRLWSINCQRNGESATRAYLHWHPAGYCRHRNANLYSALSFHFTCRDSKWHALFISASKRVMQLTCRVLLEARSLAMRISGFDRTRGVVLTICWAFPPNSGGQVRCQWSSPAHENLESHTEARSQIPSV